MKSPELTPIVLLPIVNAASQPAVSTINMRNSRIQHFVLVHATLLLILCCTSSITLVKCCGIFTRGVCTRERIQNPGTLNE